MKLPKLYKELSVIEQITLFLFTAFVIITAACNRLSIDDLFFKYRIDTVGLSGIIDEQYSRIMAYFLNGCIIAADSRIVFVLYNLISIFVFAYVLIRFIALVLPMQEFSTFRSAFLFFLLFFFCCTGHNEVFFWYTQVSTYLWCFSCILIVSCFFLEGLRYKWQLPLFLIACLFIGSSSEFLALQFLFLLAIAVWKRKIIFFTSPYFRWYAAGIFLLLLSLTSTLTSPGLSSRNTILEKAGIADTFLLSAKGLLFYFLGFLSWTRSPYVMSLSILFFIVGIQNGKYSKINLWQFLLFPVFLFCSMLVLCYQLNDLPPRRTLLICDLIGLFLLAKTAIWAGSFIKKRWHGWKIANTFVWIFLFIFWAFESLSADQYANAYDRREEVIVSSKTDPIVLGALPSTYFIQSCSITTDSLDFRNQHLKLSHHLQANIIEADMDR